MKFYGFNTTSENIKNALRTFLKQNNIYYEISGCWNGWHFEVQVDENGLQKVNDQLDEIYKTVEV